MWSCLVRVIAPRLGYVWAIIWLRVLNFYSWFNHNCTTVHTSGFLFKSLCELDCEDAVDLQWLQTFIYHMISHGQLISFGSHSWIGVIHPNKFKLRACIAKIGKPLGIDLNLPHTDLQWPSYILEGPYGVEIGMRTTPHDRSLVAQRLSCPTKCPQTAP